MEKVIGIGINFWASSSKEVHEEVNYFVPRILIFLLPYRLSFGQQWMRIVADFKIAKRILVWGVLFCVLWAFGVREFVYSVRAKVKNIIAWHKKRDARDPQHHMDPQDWFFQLASENLQTIVSMWFFSKVWNKLIMIRMVDVHLDGCKSLIVMNPTIYIK